MFFYKWLTSLLLYLIIKLLVNSKKKNTYIYKIIYSTLLKVKLYNLYFISDIDVIQEVIGTLLFNHILLNMCE